MRLRHAPRRSSLAASAVLVAFAAAASSACTISFGDFGAQQKDTWTKDYTVEPGGEFEVRNTNGRISVEPSSDGRISVVAERTARAMTDEAARELLSKHQIEEQVSADAVRLESKAPFGLKGTVTVEYHVKVPAGIRVKLRGTNGGMTLTDLPNEVAAETTNGGIKGTGLSGGIRAVTTNGGVTLEVTRLTDAGIEMEATNGGLRLRLPADAKAEIAARTTNGGIDIDGLEVETIGEVTRRRLDGRLNGGGPRIRLETTNGGIRIGTASFGDDD